MTDDLHIRIEGRAGRITLDRPKALNALTYPMVTAIEAALDNWRAADIDLVLIDAAGDKAFCAGGDIAEMYASGQRGDLDYGRQFWRDEYRLNAKIFHYPKPVVTFLQGFTMGGGVGVGCHGTHRIVGESSQIAMPECGIGLVPDVGGSLMLALAPGRLGEFLGVTGFRMGPGDAIHAGFADHFLPESEWDALKARLVETGDVETIAAAARPASEGTLPGWQAEIDAHFGADTLGDILRGLPKDPGPAMTEALKAVKRNAPLAMACCIQIVRRVRGAPGIARALDQEFRYTFRSVAQGDFIEGIRAAIIDRDRRPRWAHTHWTDLKDAEVTQMLLPLGRDALQLEETE